MKKPQKFSGPPLSFGALLRKPFVVLVARVYAQLAQQGFAELRPAHSAALRYIAPEGSRISELAEQAQITKQSMGYLVKSLEQAGYVILEPDPTDGRAKRVILTERGKSALQAALALSRQVEQEWAQQLGPEEMRQLRCSLERLSRLLNEASGSP